jgi:hypothetical protein
MNRMNWDEDLDGGGEEVKEVTARRKMVSARDWPS